MARFTSYPHGAPSWVDLATSDLQGAKSFYSSFFGWSVSEVPTEAGMYAMFMLEGEPVAAAYEVETIPPHWMTYITVDDVDAAVARAVEAGGIVARQPDDVMDSGRMAVVVDPSGASFALWQPRAHFGSGFANQPGSFTWNELQTHDTTAAAAFYSAVFGWSARTADMPGGPYTSFTIGDRPIAGMMAIRPEWGPVPPSWGVYLAVEDCDAAVVRAGELGGRVEVPAQDIANVGRFALLVDPQGAYFYILEGTGT